MNLPKLLLDFIKKGLLLEPFLYEMVSNTGRLKLTIS